MSRVEEVEQAIGQLPPEDFRKILAWMHEREEQLWDKQIERDASSGRLDFLIEEARAEARLGLAKEWPPKESNRSPPGDSGSSSIRSRLLFRNLQSRTSAYGSRTQATFRFAFASCKAAAFSIRQELVIIAPSE